MRVQMRDKLSAEYDRAGIKINNGCKPKSISKNDDGSLTMTYSTPDGGETTADFDQILMATGRHPNTSNLGLEDAGVQTTDKGCAPRPAHCAARAYGTLLLTRVLGAAGSRMESAR